MSATLKSLLTILFIVMAASCVKPLTKQDLVSINTFKIINKFPEYPNFTSPGITLFDGDYGSVNDSSYKLFITSKISKILVANGYTYVSDPAATTDLVLEVKPRSIEGMVDAHGYGFYASSLFDNDLYKTTYFSVTITPLVNGHSRCMNCYGQSLTPLFIDEMPETWDGLGEVDKIKFKEKLMKDIDMLIDIVLPKTGLYHKSNT